MGIRGGIGRRGGRGETRTHDLTDVNRNTQIHNRGAHGYQFLPYRAPLGRTIRDTPGWVVFNPSDQPIIYRLYYFSINLNAKIKGPLM